MTYLNDVLSIPATYRCGTQSTCRYKKLQIDWELKIGCIFVGLPEHGRFHLGGDTAHILLSCRAKNIPCHLYDHQIVMSHFIPSPYVPLSLQMHKRWQGRSFCPPICTVQMAISTTNDQTCKYQCQIRLHPTNKAVGHGRSCPYQLCLMSFKEQKSCCGNFGSSISVHQFESLVQLTSIILVQSLDQTCNDGFLVSSISGSIFGI